MGNLGIRQDGIQTANQGRRAVQVPDGREEEGERRARPDGSRFRLPDVEGTRNQPGQLAEGIAEE